MIDNIKLSLSDAVSLLLSWFTGGLLLQSALLHISHPFGYAYSIASYRILPESLVGPAAFFGPYTQMFIGMCLISGRHRSNAVFAAMLLFVVFAVFQAKVIVSGENIACGCFGLMGNPISYASLSIPICCAAACFVVIIIDTFAGAYSLEIAKLTE